MEKRGDGGGILPSADASEVKLLRENMRKLEEAERNVRQCVIEIAEARGSGLNISSLKLQLRAYQAQKDSVEPVVERQKTIKRLWAEPKPWFQRKMAEVKRLEGLLMLELDLSD